MDVEEEEPEQEFDTSNLDFVKLVENPTWKDVLIGLVNKEQLDPWNIDIADITYKYIEVIKGMKQLDLHVPANMILAAAVMLRIKSDAIVFKEVYQSEFPMDVPPELSFNVGFNNVETVPDLVYNKLDRVRKVTLNELLDAVEEAFTFESKRETRKNSKVQISPESFGSLLEDMDKVDVEKIIGTIYSDILKRTDQYSMVNFSDVCGNSSKEKVLSLLAVLYLNSSEYIDLKQEKFFGEILIRVVDKEKSLAKMSVAL